MPSTEGHCNLSETSLAMLAGSQLEVASLGMGRLHSGTGADKGLQSEAFRSFQDQT